MKRIFLVLTSIIFLIVGVTSQAIASPRPNLSSSNWQTDATPTPPPDLPVLYRTLTVQTEVELISAVRIRTEPSTVNNQSVILTGAVGDIYPIRPDIEWVEANGFTWIPIVADDQDAWVAAEGFVEVIHSETEVEIPESEILEAYTSELPADAVEIITEDNQLIAVNADDEPMGYWVWATDGTPAHWVEIGYLDYDFTAIGLPLLNNLYLENGQLDYVRFVESLGYSMAAYPEFQNRVQPSSTPGDEIRIRYYLTYVASELLEDDEILRVTFATAATGEEVVIDFDLSDVRDILVSVSYIEEVSYGNLSVVDAELVPEFLDALPEGILFSVLVPSNKASYNITSELLLTAYENDEEILALLDEQGSFEDGSADIAGRILVIVRLVEKVED